MRVLRLAVVAGALFYLGLYLTLALLRVNYPFELEWMEGGSVEHVRRVLEGEPLYVRPTLEFVPFIYNPLYFYLSALPVRVMGLSPTPLRWVSILASVGTLLLIGGFVRRETGRWMPAIVAAGLFAATFRLSGAWFDLARVDSLFLCLLMAALFLLRFGHTTASGLAAGLLLFGAFMTKQTALFIAAPVMVWSIWRDRRRGLAFTGAAVAAIGVGVAGLELASGGWYGYYAFTLPGLHAIEQPAILGYWASDLMPWLLPALVLGLVALGDRPSHAAAPGARPFYAVTLAGVIAGTWSSRIHTGAFENVLMPAHAWIAVLFGLALHTLPARLEASALPLPRRRSLEALLYLVALAQLARLAYDPAAQLPTPADEAAGRAFVQTLSRLEGEVLVAGHNYLPELAGKRSYATPMALMDVLRTEDSVARPALEREIVASIQRRRFAAIVVSSGSWLDERFLSRYYRRVGRVMREEGVFYPVTGFHTRPEWLYVPER